jgi:putative heme iron utilization protein
MAADTPGTLVRALLRATDRATLATFLARDATGWPYASLVLLAVDHDASPLLLISDLADHARNLAADARVSLLLDGTSEYPNPLAGPRATVLGRAERRDEARLLSRFLARHPDARQYASFADFRLYRVAIDRAHLVAGFGRIHWIDGAGVRFDTAQARVLTAAEADIVAHMNGDHADAIALIARHILCMDGDAWHMTGLDPEGCDLRMGGKTARVAFDLPVLDPDGARMELIRLTKEARRLAGGEGA